MDIIKIRAKFQKEIFDALKAELSKGIPEDTKAELEDMGKTFAAIHNRGSDAKAIPEEAVKHFNELCYKLFPQEQDGGEFVKEEQPEEKPAEKTLVPHVSSDFTVEDMVYNYIVDHLDKSEKVPQFEVYIVWKCKTLQNWKYLLASTLPDGMYYEMTFNGDKDEWYLDAYKKVENKVIPGGSK